MALRNWLRPGSRSTPSVVRRSTPVRTSLEVLEDRTVPSGFALGFGGEGPGSGSTIARDTAGNVYVSGYFTSTVDFDPGQDQRTLTSAGEDDAFVAKYGPDGTFQWARQIGGLGAGTLAAAAGGGAWTSLALNPYGTVGFSTAFTGTVNITGINADGASYSSPFSATAVGTVDALLGTLDSDGTVGWARTMGGAGAVFQPRPVGVTPDGSFIVAGSFTGTVDLDPTAVYAGNRDVLTSAGGEDIFAAKFTAAGEFAWGTRVGNTGYESATVSVDAAGNTYLWGKSNSPTLAFGSQTMTRRGTYDGFVSKLDTATGNFLWARQIGSAGASIGYGGSAAYHDPGEADPTRGNAVYVSGNFSSSNGAVAFGNTTVTLAPTDGWDGYLSKFDGDGNFVWAKQIEGVNHVNAQLMTTDAAGNVYSNLYLSGTGVTDFDPGSGEALVDSLLGTTVDGYLLKLSAAGTFEWVRPEGRTLRPVVAPDGSIYAIGTYNAATAEFDTGSGSVTLPAPSDGTTDFYLLKIDQNSLGGVFGRVLYATGYPVEGVTVSLKQNGSVVATATTGKSGEYTFRYLAAGTYTIEAAGGSRTFTLTAAGQFLSDQKVTAPAPTQSTKFYVVNDSGTDRTYQYGAVGTANTNTALVTGNTAPRGAASNKEGTRLWVADANRTVYVYSASGALLGSWTAGSLPTGAEVEGIATNGTDVWILVNSSKTTDRVFRYAGAASRLSGSQSAAGKFSLNSYNTNPKGIVTDGVSLWIVDNGPVDRVFKYTVAGALLGSWAIDPANGSPTGITLDPNNVGHLWIVDNVALKVFQYSDASGRISGSQRADRTFALAPGNTNPQDIADPPAPDAASNQDGPTRDDTRINRLAEPPLTPGATPPAPDAARNQDRPPHADTLVRGLAEPRRTPSATPPSAKGAPTPRLAAQSAGIAPPVWLASEDDGIAPVARSQFSPRRESVPPVGQRARGASNTSAPIANVPAVDGAGLAARWWNVSIDVR